MANVGTADPYAGRFGAKFIRSPWPCEGILGLEREMEGGHTPTLRRVETVRLGARSKR